MTKASGSDHRRPAKELLDGCLCARYCGLFPGPGAPHEDVLLAGRSPGITCSPDVVRPLPDVVRMRADLALLIKPHSDLRYPLHFMPWRLPAVFAALYWLLHSCVVIA